LPTPVPNPSFPAGGSGTDGGNDSAPSGGINNPADPIDSVDDEDVGGGATITDGANTPWPSDRPILPGDTIKVTPPCTFADVGAYIYNKATGTKIYLDSGEIIYDPTIDTTAVIQAYGRLGIDIWDPALYELRVTYCCPDPGVTDGFAECQEQKVGDLGPATWNDASGEYYIFGGTGFGDTIYFTTLGALAGFSVFWTPGYVNGNTCTPPCGGVRTLAYFNTSGDFIYMNNMFNDGCISSTYGYVGKLYKRVNGVWVFQQDLYATPLC
jgi:hypothetical protein